jgi:DNA-binding NarL/FixJ family response regulator
MTGAPIRVLIADDATLVRKSFRLLLETTPGFEPVGEATTGVEAVELATTLRPDVVLMDVRMPDMDGIEATRRIVAEPGLHTRVLILTIFDLDEYVFNALHAGASGFLVKDAPPADLFRAIQVIAEGDALLAPGATRRLIEEFVRTHPPVTPPVNDISHLTDRERQVLLLVGSGFTNPEIGARLTLRPATVKSHISHLMAKLGARDRPQLVIAAYNAGLVTAKRRPAPAGNVRVSGEPH